MDTNDTAKHDLARHPPVSRPPITIPGFYFGGYECSTQLDRQGVRRNLVSETQHDRFLDEDLAAARDLGIVVLREGIAWDRVDAGGTVDLGPVRIIRDAALRHGQRVIWDLFHYGYPDDLDPFSGAFAERFAQYASKVALYLVNLDGPGQWYTPVNEPSFLAWAAGEVGWFAPYGKERGYELKMKLARTAIVGMEAIRAVDPEARFVNVDPACHVVAPSDAPELTAEAAEFTGYQWQTWDMLGGRGWSDLGGRADLLDVIGVNYYLTGQWEHRRGGYLAFDDPRRRPFREMLGEVASRYPGHPILVTETGCWGDLRVPWLRMIADEVRAAQESGVPIAGVCFYPLVDMTEWHERHWMHFGFWDMEDHDGVLCRRPFLPLHEAFAVERDRTGAEGQNRAKSHKIGQYREKA